MIRDFIINVLATPEFVTLVVTTIGTALAFMGKLVYSWLSRHLSAAELQLLIDIANRAVMAAEQQMKDATGMQKKAEAERIARAFLTAYGLKVGDKQLDAAIEAAVLGALVPVALPATEENPAGA